MFVSQRVLRRESFWVAGMPKVILPSLSLRSGSNGMMTDLTLGCLSGLWSFSNHPITDPQLALTGFWLSPPGLMVGHNKILWQQWSNTILKKNLWFHCWFHFWQPRDKISFYVNVATSSFTAFYVGIWELTMWDIATKQLLLKEHAVDFSVVVGGRISKEYIILNQYSNLPHWEPITRLFYIALKFSKTGRC